MKLSDEQLTNIYRRANNEVGKARPLTTESIFTAMREVAKLVEKEALECAAKKAESTSRFEAGIAGLEMQDVIAQRIRALKGAE